MRSNRRPPLPPLAASRYLLAALLIAAGGTFFPPAHAGVDSRHRPARPTASGVWSAFAPATAEARQSVFRLRAGQDVVALVTVIDADGYALTKASELPAHGRLQVELARGKSAAAQLIGVDKPADLALLRIEGLELPPLTLGPPNPDQAPNRGIAPGTWLVSVGPGRAPVAAGIVSVEPLAIPPRRVLIGVEIRPDDRGPRVRSVIPGMGADKAGLRRGDIITHVGGKAMETRDDVVASLKGLSAGDLIEVKVRRGDEALSFTIDLAPLPESRFDRAAHMNRMGGELSARADGFERVIQHDTVLAPHEVGGPVVDLDGRVLGLNIARAGRVASYALPIDLCLAAAKRIREQAEPRHQPVSHEAEAAQ